MVIVDTSIWIDWMRQSDERLAGWLVADLVLQHPYVTAELSMGSFQSAMDRERLIDLLDSYQQITPASQLSFHRFVAQHVLFGTGIGFADAHLLEAAISNPGAQIATRDRRLTDQAKRLGIEVFD